METLAAAALIPKQKHCQPGKSSAAPPLCLKLDDADYSGGIGVELIPNILQAQNAGNNDCRFHIRVRKIDLFLYRRSSLHKIALHLVESAQHKKQKKLSC